MAERMPTIAQTSWGQGQPIYMSEVVHETQREFWRPPAIAPEESETASVMADTCLSCGTEFLLGARFCHTCGRKRPLALTASAKADAAEIAGVWESTVDGIRSFLQRSVQAASRIKFPSWLHYLHFHEIKRWIGLSTASLIAFMLGLGCIAGALLVGLLTAKNLVEWQAIQFYRAEWLLAATACFVAGILLKDPSDRIDD